jgi:hypothetical protein
VHRLDALVARAGATTAHDHGDDQHQDDQATEDQDPAAVAEVAR